MHKRVYSYGVFVVRYVVSFAPVYALLDVRLFVNVYPVRGFAMHQRHRANNVLNLLLAQNGVHFLDTVNNMQLVKIARTKNGADSGPGPFCR